MLAPISSVGPAAAVLTSFLAMRGGYHFRELPDRGTSITFQMGLAALKNEKIGEKILPTHKSS